MKQKSSSNTQARSRRGFSWRGGFLTNLAWGFVLVAVVFVALAVVLHQAGDSLAHESRNLLRLDARHEALLRLEHRLQVAELARRAHARTGDSEFIETARAEARLMQSGVEAYASNATTATRAESADDALRKGVTEYLRVLEGELGSPAGRDAAAKAAATLEAAIDAARQSDTPGLQTGVGELQEASWRFLVAQRLQVPVAMLLLAGLFLLVLRASQARRRHEAYLAQTRDAALESVRMKAMFLAKVSHELRTPMNGVIGMTGMLLETQLDPRQREYTETIRSCALGLVAIVNDLLDFSKMEAGKMRFERRDFDLNSTLESTVQFFNVQARAKRVDLQLSMQPGAPVLLRGDPGRLRQVISNLINNALKFTQQGRVRVEVERGAEDARTVELRFRVSDTGIGMSEETQRHLFQPFHQGQESESSRRGGTGLGLAICKLLVEQMGGKISVRSALGQGTTVEFTARFERGVKAEKEDVPVVQLDGNGLILVVTPNVSNRRTLGRILESWNIRWAGVLGVDAARTWAEREGAGETVRILLIDEDRPGQASKLLDQLRGIGPIRNARAILIRTPLSRAGGAADDTSRFFAVLERPVPQSELFDAISTAWSTRVERILLSSSQEAALEPLPPGGRILVAEDNPVNLKVALHMLRRLGLEADGVPDGAQALEAYQRTQYAVILMDCRMPVMDGYEAAHRICRLRGPNPPPAIIAVTAHAMQGDAEKCLAAGMDDYLSKPIDLVRLDQKLSRWLKASPPRQAEGSPAAGSPGIPAAEAAAEAPAAPSTAEPSQGLVDFAQFDAVLPSDPNERREFLSFALQELEGQKTALFRLLSNGDPEAVRAAAHKVKGASASLGLVALAALLAEIETRPEEGAAQGAALDRLWEESRTALDRIGATA